MYQWKVLLSKTAAKQCKRLPKEVIEILDQLRHDLALEGPTPNGWLVKHVLGRSGVYTARLKREYRVLYEVATPSIIILSVVHRKEAY